MDGDGATYDQQVWFYRRVIAYCEMERLRLQAYLMVLQFQLAVTEIAAPDSDMAEQLREQVSAVEQQVRSLEALEEAAKRALAQLRRDHGPIRWARAGSPEGGAGKSHYVGAAG